MMAMLASRMRVIVVLILRATSKFSGSNDRTLVQKEKTTIL